MRNKSLLGSVIIAALALLATVNPADASIAFTIDNTTGFGLGNPPFTLGFSFTANTPIVVSQLGLFDDGQDGLVEAHDVGLFDSVGNLLASTSVQSGTASTLINQFRYESIAATALSAGNYTIGALYLSGSDPLIFPGTAANFATAAGITFNKSAFTSGNTLQAPGEYSSDPSYFGPNFTFEPAAVPEPSTYIAGALMALPFGVQGLRRLRNRKQSA